MRAVQASFIFLYVFMSSAVMSQYSGDAGLGTADNFMTFNPLFYPTKNMIRLETSVSLSEQNVWVTRPQLISTFKIYKKGAIELRLPFSVHIGNFGENASMADVQMFWGHEWVNRNNFRFSSRLGVAIPPNNSNSLNRGMPMPMVYQTSLGSYDALATLDFRYKTWLFSVGYQQPLNSNNNQFLHLYFPNNQEAERYSESNHLLRSPDISLSGAKEFYLRRFLLGVGVNTIWHFRNDRYEYISADFPPVKQTRELPNTKSITMNIYGRVSYKITDNWLIWLSVGAPVYTKKSRPDGLIRYFSILPAFSYSF
jgi:hypothetical protein